MMTISHDGTWKRSCIYQIRGILYESTKRLFLLLVTMISIFNFSFIASAASSNHLHNNTNDKHLIRVENFPEEKDINNLVALALQQKEISKDKQTRFLVSDSVSLEALQLLSVKTYSDGSVEQYFAKSTIPGNQQKSSGKYDVGAIVTIYYTIYGTAPLYTDATTKVDRVTVKINDAGTNSIYVSKIDMFYHGFLNPNSSQVDRYSIINNPSSGAIYTLYANDSRSYYNNGLASVNGGAILTFSNGIKLGNNYELTIVLY